METVKGALEALEQSEIYMSKGLGLVGKAQNNGR